MSNSRDPRPKRALPPEDVSRALSPGGFDAVFRPNRASSAPTGDDAGLDEPTVIRPAGTPPHGRPQAGAGPVGTGDRGSLRRSIGLTALSTILPGAGLLGARPAAAKVVGTLIPLAFLGTVAAMGWSAYSNLGAFAGFAVNPGELRRISLVLVVIGLVWVTLIAGTHLLTRPKGLRPSKKAVGAVAVTVLSLVITAPMAVAARYSFDQQKLVETVFQPDDKIQSSSRPTIDAEEDNPWEGHPRLNILLLGADGAEARSDENGIRTDTIMVASVDTTTGDTTIVQIPRNLQYTPFPEGSEMEEIFPRGFRGGGDNLEWMVNNIWHAVERGDYPGVFEGQTYRGAEALKQGVEGVTGLKVDYFVLLDIDGIKQLIEAMGGVTVNINERLPMGRYSQGGRPSGGWLEPGPDQHLNGYEGMWYARSRATTDDYSRMARQSCLVDAIIKQANPATMLTSYEAIASASASMVLTDIPQHVLEPLVELSLTVKDAEIERLVFAPGQNGYDFANPDFDEMRQAVQDAIADEPEPSTPVQTTQPTTSATPSATASPTQAETPGPDESDSATASPTSEESSQSVSDACAYNPE